MKLSLNRTSEMFRSAILVATILTIGTQAHARLNRGAAINPNPINFGSQIVGSTSVPLTVRLQNGSRNAITIIAVSLSSLAVTYSGPALPVTLGPGSSLTAAVSFTPSAIQTYSGTLAFERKNGSYISASFSGTGVAAPTSTPTTSGNLTLNPSALSFGGITVGSSSSQAVTVSNSGGSNVTVSNVSISGPGFAASGVSSGLVLIPGQTSTLVVTFTPAATGNMTGSVTISSDAATSTNAIALSGSGVAPLISHSASLSWSPDASATTGYNVYGGTTSGGPYAKLTASPILPTDYVDASVTSGLTYYFVVTAVDSNNAESGYSNEVSALIP